MKNGQLNRVMDLVKRTGDRCVILDKETEEVLVMMNIDQYEKLLSSFSGEQARIEDMTEEELMEKINKEIAVWRANNEKEIAKLEEISERNNENTEGLRDKSVISEDTLTDLPEDEEEQFYLEPVQ